MIPVILSGGSGTRLWPVSRTNYPKQFCQLFPEPLMIQTLKRVASFGPATVITTEDLKVLTEKTLKSPTLSDTACIYEPFGQNTAPAIALVCQILSRQGKKSEAVGVFPADQLIENNSVFQQAIQLSEQYAQKNQVVTLGIKPTHPATGYGYIEIKNESSSNTTSAEDFVEISIHKEKPLKAFPIANFHEKPDSTTAQAYLNKETFFWNAGIFIFKVQTMIDLLTKHAPKLWATISQINSDLSNIKEIYNSVESISIDHALIEKLSPEQLTCIPTDMGWNDIGSWDAMSDIPAKIKSSQTIQINSKNNYLFSEKNKTYALNNVSELIVVDTNDALLITRKGCSQEIREVVKKLNAEENPRVKDFPSEQKPWGQYEILKDSTKFKTKAITIDPKSQISYQSHKQREEHWIIVSGSGEVVLNGETISVKKGSYIHIPQESKHRIRNTENIPLEFIEVQMGEYFGEDDIIRYDDDYNRT